MNIVLWVLQALLALAFLAHGLMFLFPPPDIAAMMNATLPRWFQLFLGVCETLAAVGLTVPAVTRIKPSLVSWAAAGIVVIMIGATVFHLARSEWSGAATTAVLLIMAAVVAYMRWKVRPILPRAGTSGRPQHV